MLSLVLAAAALAAPQPAAPAPAGDATFSTSILVYSSNTSSVPTSGTTPTAFTLPQFDPSLGTLLSVELSVRHWVNDHALTSYGPAILANLGTNAVTMYVAGGGAGCGDSEGDPGGTLSYCDIQTAAGSSVVDVTVDQGIRFWNAPADDNGLPPFPRTTLYMDQIGSDSRTLTSGFAPFIGTGTIALQAAWDTTTGSGCCGDCTQSIQRAWIGAANVELIYTYDTP